MSAALPAFQLASTLAPSPDEREEFAAKIRAKDAELEELREAKQSLLNDLTRDIRDLKKANKDLEKEVYDLRELTKRTLKAHWARMDELVDEADERLSELEAKGASQNTDVAKAHIDSLAHELLTRAKAGQRGVTYAEAAKILGMGKSRVCQLRSLIASDSRFNVSWHPARKNMKIICLKKFGVKEIVELNVKREGENLAE